MENHKELVINELSLNDVPKNNEIQICSNCVMDTSEPSIRFDEKGVCIYCNEYKFDADKSKRNIKISSNEDVGLFSSIINEIKGSGQGKPYDCIIGLSGGVDSSYVAWLVKQHGLRPLGVHFDNGWNSELAVSNIQRICETLNIELFTYVVDWDEFKDLQLSFLKAGVANAEIPTDHGIFATLYKLAIKFKIKYIIDGNNQSTEYARFGSVASGWVYADLRHLKAIHKKFGTISLKTFPMMSIYKKVFLQKIGGIKQVSILNYVDYNKSEAISLLKEQIGWRSYGGKHHESLFTKWHQLVYLKKRFGFDKRKIHLSDLILTNQITRQEAMDELNKPAIPDHELKQLELYVQKKLDLSKEGYEQLLNDPPVMYSEYANDEWLFKLYNKWKK